MMCALACVLLLLQALLPGFAFAQDAPSHLPAGRFGTVTVYIPEGTPQSVAIFVSGEEVGTGHHFGGEYAQLADRILAFANGAKPMT